MSKADNLTYTYKKYTEMRRE